MKKIEIEKKKKIEILRIYLKNIYRIYEIYYKKYNLGKGNMPYVM